MKKGKKYREVLGKYDKDRQYTLEEAADLLPKLSTSTFEGTVEAHIRLNLTDTEKKQVISGALTLPHPFGKEKRVLVLAKEEDVNKAKKAGADFAGLDEFIKEIQDGWLDFDVVVATPAVMPQIAALGKVLGPKGLMPNPRSGTVTTDVTAAVQEYKAGKTTFKSDKQGIIHAPIAKIKSDKAIINENALALIKKVVESSKKSPSNALKSISLSPTMGPSIKIKIEEIIESL